MDMASYEVTEAEYRASRADAEVSLDKIQMQRSIALAIAHEGLPEVDIYDLIRAADYIVRGEVV